tara:strand:+ start:738 stop:1415 length:678 start_codon:yes stop_codon:yes gene_type:complete
MVRSHQAKKDMLLGEAMISPRRTLLWHLLALLVVIGSAACAGSGQPGMALDDDDDSALADDDDSSLVGDDDDSSPVGDDDDSTPPPPLDCNVQGVAGASCVEMAWRQPSIAVAMSSCPAGDYTFTGATDWQLFLAECAGVATDPLAQHDWGQESVLVTIRQGNACFPQSSVLWFANCDDGNHFGHAFELCGDCDTTQLVVNFVAVPAGAAPVQFHECVPEELACP